MSIPSEASTIHRKKSGVYRTSSSYIDLSKSQVSINSEERTGDIESGQKIFSFNQSFMNIQQNQKIIQQKTNGLNKIKSLQEELKNYKSRSSLWQKAKLQIINLNKYLQLSSISLKCSDTAVMKQFFQAVANLLNRKEQKNQGEKTKAVQNKKKQTEIFQKLVENNKKKYELEQKMVEYEHEIKKLTQINDTLKQKFRFLNSERSSKIRQLQQQSLIILQKKDKQLEQLQQLNQQLKLQMIKYEQIIEQLKNSLQQKQSELRRLKDRNEQIHLEKEMFKRQAERVRQEDKKQEDNLIFIKQQLQKLIEENSIIRAELRKKKDEVSNLRTVIQDAKIKNDEYYQQLQLSLQQEETKRQQRLSQLLERESTLKKNLTNNARFAINRRKSRRMNKKWFNAASQQYLFFQKEF